MSSTRQLLLAHRWTLLAVAITTVPSLFTTTAPQTHTALRVLSWAMIIGSLLLWLLTYPAAARERR